MKNYDTAQLTSKNIFMNLTIKTTYTREAELEIPLPSFYKSTSKYIINDYVAIIAEETMIKLYHTEDNTSIQNTTTEGRDADIAKIHSDYELCSEEEFFEVYNRAYAALELMPVKKFYANGMINATI